jgi:hypothetical protein
MSLRSPSRGHLKNVAVDVAREGGREQQHAAGGLFGRAGAGHGDDHEGHVAQVAGDAEGDGLAADLDVLAGFLGLGEAGLDVAEGDGVAAGCQKGPTLWR